MSNTYKPIKEWANDDRPRERLVVLGASDMSTSELLAILISTGVGKESALDVARRILNAYDGDINKLARLSVQELKKNHKGIGLAKASTIVAALELGRRRESADVDREIVRCSMDIYNYLRPKMIDLEHEEFWVVYLNTGNRIMSSKCLFKGGIDSTIADVRMIFRDALNAKAAKLIVAHNHPSGNVMPSNYDEQLTKQIHKSGDMLGLKLLDHLIISDSQYYSFSDEGFI